MLNLIGQLMENRYKILEQLGEGGISIVYKAYDTRLERNVAIKVIRTNQFAPKQLKEVLYRFNREARILAQLSHPNIVVVLDCGTYGESPYFVMEYLSGGTLNRKMGSPIFWEDAFRILLPVLDGLIYIHQHGIIHRDIKPDNILLNESGIPKLSDFGILKLLESKRDSHLTGVGFGIGSPGYLAPEQAIGKLIDARADIYSLGIVLYEMVTGRRPYAADLSIVEIVQQLTKPLPAPGEIVSDLPVGVENLIIKALAPSPEDRYQDMQAFKNEMETLIQVDDIAPQKTHEPTQFSIKNTDERSDREKLFHYDRKSAGGSMVDRQWRLKVFLCHAQNDYSAVKNLHDRLEMDGIHAWLAKVDLLPGQEWKTEIRKQVRDADACIVCLSNEFNREGFKQKEVRLALDEADNKPPEQIFVIPTRFEDCEVPETLCKYQWVNLFESDGYQRLIQALDEKIKTKKSEKHSRHSPKISSQKNTASKGISNIDNDVQGNFKIEGGTTANQSASFSSSRVKNSDGKTLESKKIDEQRDIVNKPNEHVSAPAGNAPGKPQKTPGTWKSSLPIMGALITAAATIVAALIGSPAIITMLVPTATVSITLPHAASTASSLPTMTIMPTNSPTPTTFPSSLIVGGLKMLLIPASEFTMGLDASVAKDECLKNYADCSQNNFNDEKPPHKVFLNAFYIDQYEVTNSSYKLCVDAGRCKQPKETNSRTHANYYYDSKFANYPVVNIDWFMAKTYCEWREANLPTEAQWEKAARGSDKRIYPWGEKLDCTQANYGTSKNIMCKGDTVAVGSYAKGQSPYGLFDMAGNVSEWVADWYGYDYYASLIDNVSNPLGPEAGIVKVTRGGSWSYVNGDVCTTDRNGYSPTNAENHIGFRCALTP